MIKEKAEVLETSNDSVCNTNIVDDVDKPFGANLYDVLNPELLRRIAKRYPDSDMTIVNGCGSHLVYQIEDQSFAEDAIELGALTTYTSDDGEAMQIESPEQLAGFVGDVKIYKDEENTKYMVNVRGTDMLFTSRELTDLPTWTSRLLGCRLLITFSKRSKTAREGFNNLIEDILRRSVVMWEETVTENDLMADLIMSRIRRLPIVIEDADFANSRTILDRDDMYIVSTTTLEELLGQILLHKRLGEIRRIIVDYLAKKSSRRRIDGIRMSLWFFKKWDGQDV